MKVAIIHDWLVVNGGAEKVLDEILDMYPGADIFTLVDYLPDSKRDWLGNSKVNTSVIQKLPFAKSKYRTYLPLFPYAIEQFDLSAYDLVISSSYAVAKGVITGPDQKHICYCHSPARYSWDLQGQYLKESGLDKGLKSILARYFLHKFRLWDVRSSFGVDTFIANSKFISKRINKCYRRSSTVVHPPVDISRFTVCEDKEEYFLAASRLVPYKRIDLIVSAFTNLPEYKLKVIGDGPEMEKIKAIAEGYDNIEILGFQSDSSMLDHMQKAKAFVFAAEEDFGIIPLEAQACGTPVIAFGKGGALETVIDGKTGIHFSEQKEDCLIDAVLDFDSKSGHFDTAEIRSNAERFSSKNFRDSFSEVVKQTMSA